ncbi:hypothetical protein VN97_g12254 [Penicillium thymicola]|uniref:Uncharacterized protein n=1 Tax=Penicillium thymicola TaxID=293382 RepID=A0AAI9T6N8_PENTH|nr:hypothetical protein VN97_g12254 [Penicillium thymicola]
MPYMPAGGVGTNGTLPVYMVQSDYDYESVALGVHQEYIELDLFHYGLKLFSEQDFIDAGLTAEDRNLIDNLDSKDVATLIVQAEAIEARQQAIFRQLLGLHPMPMMVRPSSCPENNTRVVWQNFPNLHIVNQPNVNRFNANTTQNWETIGNRTGDPSDSNIAEDQSCVHQNTTGYNCGPAVSHDRNDPVSFPGRQVNLTWDEPGLAVGPNNSYVTSTTAGQPAFVAWLSQLNLT